MDFVTVWHSFNNKFPLENENVCIREGDLPVYSTKFEFDPAADYSNSMWSSLDRVSDLDLYVATYKQLGINLNPVMKGDIIYIVMGPIYNKSYTHEGFPKFGGYRDSLTEVVFDLLGNFIRQDFWED